jgi:hypothetical protein
MPSLRRFEQIHNFMNPRAQFHRRDTTLHVEVWRVTLHAAGLCICNIHFAYREALAGGVLKLACALPGEDWSGKRPGTFAAFEDDLEDGEVDMSAQEKAGE